MAKESQHSYVEICGDHLYLIYFPGTGRYQWCDATGPITREKALKWLLSTEALPKIPVDNAKAVCDDATSTTQEH
jgi:hypothetical protein